MSVFLALAFFIIVFFLFLATSIVAGIVTLVLFSKQKEYFKKLFKPGFFYGAVGVILFFIVNYFLEGDTANSTFNILMPIPLLFICAGVSIGTAKSLRLRRNTNKNEAIDAIRHVPKGMSNHR